MGTTTYPWTDESRNKIWHMLTMKYYPGSKRKDILTYATAWMNLEDLILNEISQLQKDKYYMMSLLHGL